MRTSGTVWSVTLASINSPFKIKNLACACLGLLLLVGTAHAARPERFPSHKTQVRPLPPAMQKKIDWLDRLGSPIRFGPLDKRYTTMACRRDDGYAIIRRNGGLQKDTLLHHEVVNCPDFF